MAARGQVLAGDYIVASSVFIIILASTVYMWEKVVYRAGESIVMDEMVSQAHLAANQLVRTGGTPANWESNATSASAVGIAKGHGVMSADKAAAISSLDYRRLKAFLGVGGHEVWVRVSDLGGVTVYEAGQRPDGDFVANSRRMMRLENRTVTVDVSVWDGAGSESLNPTAGGNK